MSDRFKNYDKGVSGPAENLETITPHDTAELNRATCGLYVGGGGNIRVVTVRGDEATFVNVAPGTFLPVRAIRVKATGTTATSIVGLS